MLKQNSPIGVQPVRYEIRLTPCQDKMEFAGFVRILIDLRESTRLIILDAADLDFVSAAVEEDRSTSISIKANPAAQNVSLELSRTLSAGTYTLQIEYSGKISESAEGLFVARYASADGQKQILLTQFEAVAARKVFPCWDSPNRKAIFAISITIRSNETAVSNMPIRSVAEMENGLQVVSFVDTPKMSTYLLFVAVGELERIEVATGTTTIAVMARKGSAEKGRFALNSAIEILRFYNSYFDVPYPLPKVDLVAAPSGGGFGAMENWGAILFFEKSLLLEPEIATEYDRQRVFVVVAHELAHQWFGNLVTMTWWDDLWLNEGFASWMENKATQHLHPEWNPWLQSEPDRQHAMLQDAKRTTHPVVQPVNSGVEADQAFDDITYRKGQAIIRMLEEYLGEDSFRGGVRRYVRRFAYQNTTTSDLWLELEKFSGKSIAGIADDFTRQPGVPLIDVKSELTAAGASRITLTQGRFALDQQSQKAINWQVPVVAAAPRGGAPKLSRIVSGPGPTIIELPNGPPIKINFGHTGYYRTRYTAPLLKYLLSSFDTFGPADRLGLLWDQWALAQAELSPIATYLNLVEQLKPQSEEPLWLQVVEALTTLDVLYLGLDGRQRFRAYANRVLSRLFKLVGWQKQVDEPASRGILREALLIALGRFNQEVAAEARQRFLTFLSNPNDPAGLPPDIRRPAVRVASLWADAKIYGDVVKLANETASFGIKDQLFVTLSSAQDKDLAQQSLALALSADVPPPTCPGMITRVALDNPMLAWRFALENAEQIVTRLDALQRHSFIPIVAAQSADPEILKQLRHFLDNVAAPEARPQLEAFYAELEFRVKLRSDLIPEIDKWLANRRSIRRG